MQPRRREATASPRLPEPDKSLKRGTPPLMRQSARRYEAQADGSTDLFCAREAYPAASPINRPVTMARTRDASASNANGLPITSMPAGSASSIAPPA